MSLHTHLYVHVFIYRPINGYYKIIIEHMHFTGGWNNNPTVIQFRAAFRRLISRCGALTAGSTGNAVALDDTELIQAATSTYVPPTVCREHDQAVDMFELGLGEFDDPLPLHVCHRMEPILENILVYIGGWVVRKALMKLTCSDCRTSLVHAGDLSTMKYGKSYFFLQLKSNGGLLSPSEGVMDILVSAEHHMRQLSDIHTASKIVSCLHIQTSVMSDLGHVDIFKLGAHIAETQHGIENHHLTLLKLIVQVFYNVRQHHIMKLHNLKLRSKSVRQKCTKTVIFLGQ